MSEKVYEVYEKEKSGHECIIHRYGFFTGKNAKEEAMKRAKEVTKEKYPKMKFEEHENEYKHTGMCQNTYISVKEHKLNEPFENSTTVYT